MANQVWDGSMNSDWNEPANWQSNNVPDTNAYVVIPAGTPNSPQLTSSITVNVIDLDQNAILDVNGFTIKVKNQGYITTLYGIINNSNSGTDIVINSSGAQGSGNYGLYISYATINDNIIVNTSESALLMESETGACTFNGDVTYNIGTTGAARIGYKNISTYNGNVTVTRSVAGYTSCFQYEGIVNGDFIYTNTVHGDNVFGYDTNLGIGLNPTKISGIVNITISDPLLLLLRVTSIFIG